MDIKSALESTPWDSVVFGTDTYEIKSVSEEVLMRVLSMPGHFTVKIDPLASKKLLHEFGFYYCDTLIEPHCRRERFRGFDDEAVSFTPSNDFDGLMKIAHGAFSYDRFHRDFNINKGLADVRYDNWFRQLYSSGNVLTLLYRGAPAGFFGVEGNKIVLHAVAEGLRGRGLAKYLWTAVCRALFSRGHEEIYSSVSAANLAVINLYARLGFSFKNAVDIYHRSNK